MISRFFIDRPIFATVLSIAIALIGGIALIQLPLAQYPRITPPGISITINYPGASAQVVADTVAAPIEQEVNGVPGMLYMSSQSGNDGSYKLTVTFDIGTDVNSALVMVQNRVALAMPQLPTSVQNQGITIRKRTPDILMIINFFCTAQDNGKDRYDDIYLSNYATINIKDELLRVEGVSDLFYIGERDYSMRAWLNPQKMTSLNLAATDVASAIQSQNIDAPIGQIGQPPNDSGHKQSYQLTLDTLGRLDQVEQFRDIIIKAAPQPPVISPVGVPLAAQSIGAPSAVSGVASVLAATVSLSGSASAARSAAPGVPMPGVSTAAVSTTSSSTAGAGSAGIAAGGILGAAGVPGGGSSAGGGTSVGGGSTAGGAMEGILANANSAASNAVAASASSGLSSSDVSALNSSAGGTVGASSLSGGALGGAPASPATGLVRLGDVARVEVGAQDYSLSCRFDGKPSVGLGIYQLPGTNALDVAQRVQAKMEELKRDFPDGLDYQIAYDTTPYVRDSIDEVEFTLIEAVVVVGCVVLLFLQDWRAMILPMIDVPVSLVGTCAVMYALGFSLNNISFFGLVLTIGIVVDDAIVVLENIERQMAKGYDARTAALRAMEEVTGPIVAVGLVLCAVFVPCAFITGITGQFFQQFAVTITASTIISAINAITMTPSRAVLIFRAAEAHQGRDRQPEAFPWWFFAVLGGFFAYWLGARFLAGRFGLPEAISETTPVSQWIFLAAPYFVPGAIAGGIAGWWFIRPVNAFFGWIFRGFNRVFDGLTAGYAWSIGKLLRFSIVVLAVYGGLLVLTVYLLDKAPTGFIPQQDQGRLIASIQLADSESLELTEAAVAKIEKIARETEGVDHIISMSGMSFALQANSSNLASMFIVLKPFSERTNRSDVAIMHDLTKRWAQQVPQARVDVYPGSPIPGLGTAGGFKFMVEDRGGLGLPQLQSHSQTLVDHLADLPPILRATNSFRSNTPQLFLDADRSKAVSMGVSIDDVNQTLNMYLGSLYVNSYNAFGRHWQVTVQADAKYRDRESNIRLLDTRNNQNEMVSLATLTSPRLIGGPISITRYNLYASAPINGNLRTGYSTGTVVGAVDGEAMHVLPKSMKADWTEVMFLQIQAGNSGMYAFALAVVCVFLALSALYESWSLPAAVILVVPMCLLFSLAGVLLTGRDVNIFVQIGLVVLVALACKNAILIVEFGKQLSDAGQSTFDATVDSSRMRLRPILMTSFAFIFGVIPLAVATGAGAEMRRSLGVAVFYGMLGVTLFGIFLTPVFFFVIERLGQMRVFASARTRAAVSYVTAATAGAVFGHLLALLQVVLPGWGPAIGAAAAVAVNWGLREIGRQLKQRVNGNGRRGNGGSPLAPSAPPSAPPPQAPQEGGEQR